MRFLKNKLRPGLYIVAFFAFFLLLFVFLTSDFVKTQNITCKTQFGPCTAAEEERLAPFLGQNIFALKSAGIKEAFNTDFRIREVYVQRIFPNKLVVFLEKRKPLVSVGVKNSPPGVFLLDRDGIILEFAQNFSLPVVVLEKAEGIVVGEAVDEKVISSGRLLYLTYKLNLTQERLVGELAGEKLTVNIDDVSVRYPLDRDTRSLVGALQLILSRSRIEGKLPKEIDLSYTNPVLTY